MMGKVDSTEKGLSTMGTRIGQSTLDAFLLVHIINAYS